MRHPIVKILAICPYCKAKFIGRDELKVIDSTYAHMKKVHPETEKAFREIDRKAAIVPKVKLLKGGY